MHLHRRATLRTKQAHLRRHCLCVYSISPKAPGGQRGAKELQGRTPRKGKEGAEMAEAIYT